MRGMMATGGGTFFGVARAPEGCEELYEVRLGDWCPGFIFNLF